MHPGLSGKVEGEICKNLGGNGCTLAASADVMATPEYLQYEAFNMNVAFKGVLDPSVKLFIS